MSEPAAYLLTWTCYGTWLHGDERGSVDSDDRTPGAPFVAPSTRRARDETRRLRNAPVSLGAQARRVVRDTVVEHCELRGWTIVALNVRANHVHAVIENAAVTPERMLGQLKSWSTRRLREAGLLGRDARVWTHHGSTRYLWNRQSVADAVAYVTDGQGPDV